MSPCPLSPMRRPLRRMSIQSRGTYQKGKLASLSGQTSNKQMHQPELKKREPERRLLAEESGHRAARPEEAGFVHSPLCPSKGPAWALGELRRGWRKSS